MRGRSCGKTGPPVPGLTRVGGGAIREREIIVHPPKSYKAVFQELERAEPRKSLNIYYAGSHSLSREVYK